MSNEKYILALITLMIFGYGRVHAQSSTGTSSDQVSLNVVLHPVQTIVVNPSQKSIDLEYRSEEDYKNGVSNELDDHLTIYSTGGFDINIERSNEQPASVNKNPIGSDVKVTITKGSNNNLADVAYGANVPLTAASSGVLRSGTGGVAQTFNVKYEASGDDTYINYDDEGGAPAVYTTTVTYSIAAQ